MNDEGNMIILHAGSEDGWIENILLLSVKNIKYVSMDYYEDLMIELHPG